MVQNMGLKKKIYTIFRMGNRLNCKTRTSGAKNGEER